MSGIPNDILKAAGAVVADICEDTRMTLMGDVDKMAQPIARAILAERERYHSALDECLGAIWELRRWASRDEYEADPAVKSAKAALAIRSGEQQ